MIEVKTAELSGLALDWAVGIADGRELELPNAVRKRTCVVWCDPFVIKREGHPDFHDKTRRHWKPSTDWADGGPLVEAYDVELVRFGDEAGYLKDPEWNQKPCVVAYIQRNHADGEACFDIDSGLQGETRLIAACRAIVRAKLGNTVQVPRELLQ
nr:phage protein NinX family protein [Pseudomonas sp. PNPG3]